MKGSTYKRHLAQDYIKTISPVLLQSNVTGQLSSRSPCKRIINPSGACWGGRKGPASNSQFLYQSRFILHTSFSNQKRWEKPRNSKEPYSCSFADPYSAASQAQNTTHPFQTPRIVDWIFLLARHTFNLQLGAFFSRWATFHGVGMVTPEFLFELRPWRAL